MRDCERLCNNRTSCAICYAAEPIWYERGRCQSDGRFCNSRTPRPRADHCAGRLQPLDGSTGCIGDPSVHRDGLRFQCILAAAVARVGRDAIGDMPANQLRGRTLHHHLRLADLKPWLDVHAVLRDARIVRGDLGRLARAGRTAQGRRRFGALLVRRSSDRQRRRSHASALAPAARTWNHRRHWARTGLHFPGIDADQMVSRSARHGYRNGDYGFRWRRHDRRAPGRHPHECLQVVHIGRGVADLGRDGSDLFGIHAGRRLRIPAAARRLAARGLDPSGPFCHRDDHHAPCPFQERS